MPAPAPPPTLAWSSADVQAAGPATAVLDPEPAEVDPVLAALVVLPDVAEEAADEEAGAAADDDEDDEDDAHPAARAPAASNGMTSQAFFTSSPHHVRN
jgi:hypothetical protein